MSVAAVSAAVWRVVVGTNVTVVFAIHHPPLCVQPFADVTADNRVRGVSVQMNQSHVFTPRRILLDHCMTVQPSQVPYPRDSIGGV